MVLNSKNMSLIFAAAAAIAAVFVAKAVFVADSFWSAATSFPRSLRESFVPEKVY